MNETLNPKRVQSKNPYPPFLIHRSALFCVARVLLLRAKVSLASSYAPRRHHHHHHNGSSVVGRDDKEEERFGFGTDIDDDGY